MEAWVCPHLGSASRTCAAASGGSCGAWAWPVKEERRGYGHPLKFQLAGGAQWLAADTYGGVGIFPPKRKGGARHTPLGVET